jgi:hypothetical protein
MKCQKKHSIRSRKRVRKSEGQTEREVERHTEGRVEKPADSYILAVIWTDF